MLTDDKASERAIGDRLVQVAERTDRTSVPVLLQCDVDTLTSRVDSPQRRDRSKWVDAPADAALLILERLDG